MSQPITRSPIAVETEILRLVALLEDRHDELGQLYVSEAEAESDHKKEWAKAFLEGEGTDAKKRATADVLVDHLYRKRKIAEAVAQACKESTLSIRANIDGLRTVAANLRSQT